MKPGAGEAAERPDVGGTSHDIWTRLTPSREERNAEAKKASKPVDPDEVRAKNRRLRIASVIAALVWCYLTIKVFVVDVDYMALKELFPKAPWVLDLRIVVAAIAFLALVHAFKRHLWLVLYGIFWPAVVLFWYLPRKMKRFFSWVSTIAVTSIAYSVSSSLQANITVRTAEVVGVFLISGAKPRQVMLPIALVLSCCLVRTYFRSFRRTFWPERFLRKHAEIAQTVLDSGLLLQWATVPSAATKSRARRLNPRLQTEIKQNLSFALIAIKLSHFYAYQLERYRRSPAPFILGALSYSTLFIYSAVMIAAVNVAVFKYSPTEFVVSGNPGVLDWLHYSFSAFFVNGVDNIAPSGALALGLKLITMLLYGVVFVMFLLNGFLSHRAKREDEATKETIASITNHADRIIKLIHDQYKVTPGEAVERLLALNVTMVGMAVWFASKVPGDFLGSVASNSTSAPVEKSSTQQS